MTSIQINREKITVAISMVTYNHELYISQAIEGVLSQKTNFNYKLIISDDKSTDKTSIICKEYSKKYPEKIFFTENKKNIGATNNWIKNLKICKKTNAKFIAICEGDDYWIHEKKLQLQVNLLNKNLSYGMVHTNYDRLYNISGIKIKKFHNILHNNYHKIQFEDLLLNNRITTATVLFRSHFLNDIFKFHKIYWSKISDIVLWLSISSKSRIAYINKSTSVYRLLEKSASNNKNFNKAILFLRNSYKISLIFIKNLGLRSKKQKLKKEYCKKYIKKAIDYNEFSELYKFMMYPLTIIKYFIILKIAHKLSGIKK